MVIKTLGTGNIFYSNILLIVIIIIYWFLVSIERNGFQRGIFIPWIVYILLLFGPPQSSLLILSSTLLLGPFHPVNNSSFCL